MGRKIIHCCADCDWFTTAVNSGLCTNPDSKKCGELVGGCSEYCEEWTKKVERETTPIESKKTITNADRIRAMSDEELAKHFSSLICDINEGVEYHEAPSRWLEWLKQPAEVKE